MSKLCAFVMTLSSGPALAIAMAGAAQGTFATGGATLKVVDAFAYEDKAGFGDETAIHVRLSAAPLDHKALDAVIDYGAELRRQRTEGLPYADLQFSREGVYQGASYALGGKANCGFCGDSSVASKAAVKVAGNTLQGNMRIAPADYKDGKGPAIDVTLNVPVAIVSNTMPLPAAGGDPAKALDGCRQIVKRGDAAALKTTCLVASDARIAQATQYNMDTDVNSILAFYELSGADSLKLTTLKVTGGRTKGDWAELTIEGSGDSGKRKGSVFLLRTGGAWRFDHDRVESVY
jgi:hypothetical protein